MIRIIRSVFSNRLNQAGLCKVQMRTADNYKLRKTRKVSAPLIYVQLRATYLPCGLVLIQKWQVPKHLDLKGRLMSGTLCKTSLGLLRVLKRRPLATLLKPCYRPKFLVALKTKVFEVCGLRFRGLRFRATRPCPWVE